MIIMCRAISLTLALALLSAGPALAQKKGGDLVIAQPAGTNTLDPHFTASAAARNMMLGMYETLVTIDETATPIPLLAAKWDVLDNGLTYRFELRKGVHFHTGKEMTSADVKASLERFGRVSPEKQTMALLRALLLQMLYSVRSERQLMEQLDYNLLFRWFVGLSMDDPVWDPHGVHQESRAAAPGRYRPSLLRAGVGAGAGPPAPVGGAFHRGRHPDRGVGGAQELQAEGRRRLHRPTIRAIRR